MKFSYLVSYVLVFLAASQFCSVQSALQVVKCMDQQEYCECTATECHFSLRITELQTFASYELKDGIELTEGAAGNVYFVDGTGYRLAPTRATTAETDRKKCKISTPLVFDSDFNQRNCSVPVTVDGVTYRLFIAVNGRIPGPTLIVNENSTVRVSVTNKLNSEGVTIHWHGMHQSGTPWMDGVGFISQAPITPGATFDYVFNATPPGTHWYHSHVGAQRTDGLFGALIVREKNFVSQTVPALIEQLPDAQYTVIEDIPKQHTITLLDWQREASLDLFVRIHSALGFYPQKRIGDLPRDGDVLYNATSGPDFTEVGPIPYWSGLINGRGRHTLSEPSPLSVFPVTANRAYRFRIVGAQSVYAYSFSIDNHKLIVIATDGHFIQPVTVDYLIVHSGERYDFILETDQTERDHYWIRAETLENLQPGEEHSARAILNYGSENSSNFNWTNINIPESPNDPCTNRPCDFLNCPFLKYPDGRGINCINLTSLRPLIPQSKPFTPCDNLNDCTKFFNFGFEGISVTSAINGKNFRLPATPYQTTCGRYDQDRGDCSGCSERNPQACRCIHVTEIMRNETFTSETAKKTQIMVFSAVGERSLREFTHPVHLHGHSFHVLHVGYGDYNALNELVNASTDIDCNLGNDGLCMQPTWRNQEIPAQVSEAANNLNRYIQKDTVNVPAGGYVAIAFRADNPGYWFLHCHIEVHQLEGMGVLIEEYNHTQHRANPESINDIGNFHWTIEDHTNFVSEQETCEERNGAAMSIGFLNIGVIIFSVLAGGSANF